MGEDGARRQKRLLGDHSGQRGPRVHQIAYAYARMETTCEKHLFGDGARVLSGNGTVLALLICSI